MRVRSTLRPSTPALAASLLALAVAAALASPAAAFTAKGYEEGEEIVITGVISDGAGRPVPGVTVRLEASRSEIALKRLGRVRRHPTRIVTESDGEGEYSLTWPWHDYYNRFELMLGITVRDEDGDKFKELSRTDLSKRIRQGSPLVVPLVLAETAAVERNRAFLAAVDTPDERQVFELMGTPERLDETEIGEQKEVTWWYFRAGKAYRFVAGRLDQVIHFEPVTSF